MSCDFLPSPLGTLYNFWGGRGRLCERRGVAHMHGHNFDMTGHAWTDASCQMLPADRPRSKAPALPPGAHRHVPRALWLFARKREGRHLIGLRIGGQLAESHYLAKRYRMICSSITQLLFDFFPKFVTDTFEPTNKRRLRCWPALHGRRAPTPSWPRPRVCACA